MQNNLKNFLMIAIFLLVVLVIGPRVYVFLEIPHKMKPVNYYDFLNSVLLMIISYKILIKK